MPREIPAVDQVIQGTVHKISNRWDGHTPGSPFPSPDLTAARYRVNRALAQDAYKVLENYGWLIRSRRHHTTGWICATGVPVPLGARPER